ncbi:MAG: hypothetical protein RIS35_971 [Pseudomonadota bacterium]
MGGGVPLAVRLVGAGAGHEGASAVPETHVMLATDSETVPT